MKEQRLIDANAILELIAEEKYGYANCDDVRTWQSAILKAFLIIDSAPTVETTDDVLARLPEMTSVGKTGSWKFAAIMFDEEGTILDDMGFVAKTPLEALKKLEASINRK